MKIFAAFLATVMLFGAIHAGAPTSPSICDAYAGALNITQQTLMNVVLGAIVGNLTKDPVTLPYFNGMKGPYNYVGNATAAARLTSDLASFFALNAALNCTPGTVAPYTGVVDQKAVHTSMVIPLAVFNRFNSIVIQTAGSLGVSAADQDRLLVILNTFRAAICNDPNDPACKTPSLCDKYSELLFLSNNGLLTVVVDQTVAAALASTLKKFFDGTYPGTIDYTKNTAALNTLKLHLRQFFAAPNILGCTDGSLGAYQGNPDMIAVHKPFPITLADFNAFNNALITVLANNGVTPADQAAVLSVLNSTKGVICNQADCGNGNGSGINALSFFLLLAALLIALF